MTNIKKLCMGLGMFAISHALPAIEVSEFNLDNGLKILVKEDHRAPVVVSQVWYKVGGSYESEGTTGLSHMVEHMMFKGTDKHGPGDFSLIMSENGAEENAFTARDYTAYFQTIAKDRLELCFEMEADRMRSLKLDQSEFAKEREVVLEERRTRTDDNPNSLLYEYFAATAYQTSTYQNPVIGWRSDIENYTLADLQAWYQRWYAPNNAILVVVGDVEPKNVYALAKKHFGPLKPSDIQATKPRPEVPQMGTKRITLKRPAKLPYLIMGYKVPVLNLVEPEQAWEVYALDLLAEILDGDDSSRLSKNLVRGQEIATSVSAGYSLNDRLEDLFTFAGIPAKGQTVETLEQAIYQQVEVLKNTLVEEAELDRIKVRLKASKIYEQDSLFYQGMKIGMLETVGLDWRVGEDYLKQIAAITPEQIQAVAKKYLVEDRLTVGVLEPTELDNATAVTMPITMGVVH